VGIKQEATDTWLRQVAVLLESHRTHEYKSVLLTIWNICTEKISNEVCVIHTSRTQVLN